MALTWIRDHDWDADDWRERSLCRETSPELFFPVGTTGEAVNQIEAAKAVCTKCLARPECLEFALSTNQEAGVWGGATEEERRRMRRARRSAARAPEHTGDTAVGASLDTVRG